MKFNLKNNSVLVILVVFIFTYGCKKNEIEKISKDKSISNEFLLKIV